MIATDSIKALANRTSLSVAEVRDIARAAGYQVTYEAARHTWVIVGDAATVRAFNDYLLFLIHKD